MLLCVSSCVQQGNDKEKETDTDEFLKKSDPEFDSNRQVIYFKELRENDIQANLDFSFDMNRNQINLGCMFTFYNYGGNIKLFNGYIDDSFVQTLGQINAILAIQNINEFTIGNRNTDEKYGDWAYVNVSNGMSTLTNIFMTPLALKAYDKGERDNFIFVNFSSDDKYMNVIFHGTNKESMIASKFQNTIISNSMGFNVNGPNTGPGIFWHEIN
jgi:hypothetical protein